MLFLSVAAAAGCLKSGKRSELAVAIQARIGSGSVEADAAVQEDLTTFYERRAFEPVWVTGSNALGRVDDALGVIRQAEEHGLDPGEYSESLLIQRRAELAQEHIRRPDRAARRAELETSLTAAVLRLGRDVALGRTDPSTIAEYWTARRAPPDLVTWLQTSAQRDTAGLLDAVRPRHPEYAALQKALASLRAQEQSGGWPMIPPGRFRLGTSHPAVIALRQRLAASGLLAANAAIASPVFDEALSAAVKAFQELHAIKATGHVDTVTRAAMNVPVGERIRQVTLNLERWRWMPDDLGERHLLVNIPYFHVVAREHGKTVMDIRVVVGALQNKTPVFSDEMETVVFSPYWHIPDSIKIEETAPAAMRDPSYLERNNIEVFRGSRPVDVSQVNWADRAELKQLSFRQRPGAQNALGHVKFLFPNKFDVYLHDTPADSLFERSGRALSHGCVRVEEPEVLAGYLLRDQPEWDAARIRDAMHAGSERHVRLTAPVPVHLTYFTAWVDENGGLHFQPDVYRYDAVQAADLAQRIPDARDRARSVSRSPRAED